MTRTFFPEGAPWRAERSIYKETKYIYDWICNSLLPETGFERIVKKDKELIKYYQVEKRRKKRVLQLYGFL